MQDTGKGFPGGGGGMQELGRGAEALEGGRAAGLDPAHGCSIPDFPHAVSAETVPRRSSCWCGGWCRR